MNEQPVSGEASSSLEPQSPNTDVILECRSLSRDFKSGETTLHVLRGVDFQLYQGEIASIVGASGAGKSTLMHLLGLLDTPSDGRYIAASSRENNRVLAEYLPPPRSATASSALSSNPSTCCPTSRPSRT